MLTPRNSVRSLKLRLLIRIVLPLFAVALALGGWRTWYVFETAKEIFDRNLTAVSLAVARDLASSGVELLSQETLLLLTDASGGKIFYHVHGPDGAYVAGFGYPPRSAVTPLSGATAPELFDSTHLGRPVRAVALGQLVNSAGLEGIATITVWQEQAVRQQFAIRQAVSSAVIIVLLVGAVIAFVWFGVSSGLAPLNQLRSAVGRRNPQELRPNAQAVPEEVQPLVGTLNDLFQEVQNSIDARDRFISNAAHQLRNPIAAVQALAESALNAKTTDKMTRRVAKTLTEARHTSQLAEQLLMLERLRHSPESFKREPFDAADSLLYVAQRFSDRALDRNVEFGFDQDDQPAPLVGDPELFGEAIENLLDNALAHAGPGLRGIALILGSAEGEARITVRDDGRGIPEADREIIFERFTQLDFGRGSGLGLAIAREILRAHGGEIRATGELSDTGAGFAITLPLRNSPGS
ncbi:ATP-binding protein [Dinoroseobacter sp. S375]|uniref:sensor histidine kinase n=1 Tax=Dinoroseobacter sp. S375 TaxID=3415136 RepID=UPI003C798FE2